MDTDTSEDAGGPAILSGNEVMEAQFSVQDATEKGEPAKRLYLKTFEMIDRDILLWQERPESEWPLLATIFPNSIVMYPIHANPHTKRYLTPKHGRFKTVIYEDDADGTLPNDPQDVAAHVALRLASNIFDQPSEGLGLIKDLDSVWQSLSLIPQADVLVIGKKIRLRLDGRTVFIDQNKVDSLRRAFNRTKTRGRQLIQHSKHSLVHDQVLAEIAPDRFQRIERKAPPLVQVRRENAVQTAYRERAERRASIQSVQKQVDVLAAEAPSELLRLHAEIERATLTAMIGQYREMLNKSLKDAQWQRFFEKHKFVLSLAFARPVELSHTQFHAQGSTLAGTGAQIGDFLFREQGLALVSVRQTHLEARNRPEQDRVHTTFRGHDAQRLSNPALCSTPYAPHLHPAIQDPVGGRVHAAGCLHRSTGAPAWHECQRAAPLVQGIPPRTSPPEPCRNRARRATPDHTGLHAHRTQCRTPLMRR